MRIRWLLQTLMISIWIMPLAKADMPFGGMSGMMGMSGMAGMSMMPTHPIVELIAGNIRNTRGWYEQRSNGQLILYPIFPLQPVLPMLPLSPSSTMVSMSNLSMAMAAGMSPPQSYVFITSQGWYTVDVNGILALHPTSASISAAPPMVNKRANSESEDEVAAGGMGMMGAP